MTQTIEQIENAISDINHEIDVLLKKRAEKETLFLFSLIENLIILSKEEKINHINLDFIKITKTNLLQISSCIDDFDCPIVTSLDNEQYNHNIQDQKLLNIILNQIKSANQQNPHIEALKIKITKGKIQNVFEQIYPEEEDSFELLLSFQNKKHLSETLEQQETHKKTKIKI